MTQAQYNKLTPHKQFLDAVLDCMEKALPIPSIPRALSLTLVDISEETGGRPVDRACGDCVESAIKDTLRKYKIYESQKENN